MKKIKIQGSTTTIPARKNTATDTRRETQATLMKASPKASLTAEYAAPIEGPRATPIGTHVLPNESPNTIRREKLRVKEPAKQEARTRVTPKEDVRPISSEAEVPMPKTMEYTLPKKQLGHFYVFPKLDAIRVCPIERHPKIHLPEGNRAPEPHRDESNQKESLPTEHCANDQPSGGVRPKKYYPKKQKPSPSVGQTAKAPSPDAAKRDIEALTTAPVRAPRRFNALKLLRDEQKKILTGIDDRQKLASQNARSEEK